MKSIREYPLATAEAALWWLGQAGYIIRSGALTVGIDLYLSDSCAGPKGEFTRLFPPPLAPEEIAVDVLITTHSHADHLDSETIRRYSRKAETWFIAPRLAVRYLSELGVPESRILRVDAGETRTIADLEVRGTFALPTGPDVLDTTGYLLCFANGRSVYHTSDTAFHPLVLAAAPREPEVMLVPINGKWGNPGPEQAAEFAAAVAPRMVVPNHYDLMALNAENPEVFRWFCDQRSVSARCVIAQRMQPLAWNQFS